MRTVLGLLCCVFAIVIVQGAIGSYDYCGKPCNDPSGIVCAYNQVCYNVYVNSCAMKKRNCDYNDRFLAVSMASCLLSAKKCRF